MDGRRGKLLLFRSRWGDPHRVRGILPVWQLYNYATRHARHYDLSLQLITQTVDEFFSRADSDELAQKTKAIADNCVLKIFHQVEGLTDANAKEWLDLSAPEAQFIRRAKPGSDEYGYSQALIEIGEEGRYPVNVHALPEEEALITRSTSDNDGQQVKWGEEDSGKSGDHQETRRRTSEEGDDGGVEGGDETAVVANGGSDGENSSIDRGSDDGRREELVSEGTEDSASRLSDDLDQEAIAELLNNADPLELRRVLDQEEIDNLDTEIKNQPND